MGNTAIDLSGKKFGKLSAIQRAGKDKSNRALWLCKCDCGNTRIVNSRDLRRVANISCGCAIHRRETPYPYKKERLYMVWCGMKKRCNNPNSTDYPNYGGRGVRVCEEWNCDYQAFKQWSIQNGYNPLAPTGACTLDRMDNNGDYRPENCRWTDNKTQSLNRRTNRRVTYKGETKTIEEFSQEFGIKSSTIARRLNVGWDVERSLTMKPMDVGRWKHT